MRRCMRGTLADIDLRLRQEGYSPVPGGRTGFLIYGKDSETVTARRVSKGRPHQRFSRRTGLVGLHATPDTYEVCFREGG